MESLTRTVLELKNNKGLAQSLYTTQDVISQRVERLESSVSNKLDLMQTLFQSTASSISSDVKILSIDVRRLSEEVAMFDKKGGRNQRNARTAEEILFSEVAISVLMKQNNDTNNMYLEIVSDLKAMLDENNVLVKCFRMTKERMMVEGRSDVKLNLTGRRSGDGRRYNLPSASDVAALIVGDFDESLGNRDILVETQTGQLKRINELNPAYLALQYPILFPYGEDGYREDIPFSESKSSAGGRKKFIVDAYTMVESARLTYIRLHQKQLRCEMYKGLHDALLHGETNASTQGRRIILPSSFTGGARYKIQNYQDAMAILRDLMVHGPCGETKKNSPCMSNGRCTKHFPKKFVEVTSIDEDRYPSYKRKDNGYISPCEAAWRIFGFDIQYRDPLVERLSFHLPNEQNITFSDSDEISTVLDRPTINQSMFLAWMEANKKYPEARELTYAELPMKFVWKQETREFVPRKQRFSIGHIFYVPPGCGEMYYLRCLLNVNSGATCYDDITFVNGVQYRSFRDACYALGLLSDDKEYIDGIIEKTLSAYLRSKGEIVLNVASSGIASLLLPGGRTVYSHFAIPFNPNEESTCNIKQGSHLAELIVKSKLIIWDETPMTHKFCFEALDKSMKDIIRFVNPSSLHLPFGGKTVVFGGDFRRLE
ncbi:uncharacterized protein [Primulina huaijiensis]|uniref:uncharacterized protein n=1 Tax=Primulina huaijiensis TaxID=1492673 RepID=UPI003CC6EA97